MKTKDQFPTAPLTQMAQALESSRDSGFDLSTAIGELVDNSYEGKAKRIRINIKQDDQGSVTDLAVADDGVGIPPTMLAAAMSLGYSSRYGSREGLGRFGVGLKLASLSQALRTEIYTTPRGERGVFATHLDLDEVREGGQTELSVAANVDWPEDFVHLMRSADGKPFASGTLVVWRKIDRLQQGGRFGTSVPERVQDLVKFLARAYRRFLDKGLKIELDDRPISLHDPLFRLDNQRVIKKFGRNLAAKEVDGGTFDIDGHGVRWTVTLLPEELRRVRGAGGRATKSREEFKELYIPDNASKISILRNGREIYYDIVPKLYPGGKDIVDRYIGVEVEFPAQLDEYFQVRNVKRGAEPVSKLRNDLRKAIEKPIEAARKDIRNFWDKVEQEEQAKTGDDHLVAHEAADDFDQTAPSGQANPTATDEEASSAIAEIVSDLGIEDGDSAANVEEWLRDSFDKRSVTLVDSHWPGKDLLDIRHLNGKAIVQINKRHPFMSEIVLPLKAMAPLDPDDLDTAEASRLLRKIGIAIDLMMMAYAKAENMHADPDTAYEELRSHWGLFLAGLIREARL